MEINDKQFKFRYRLDKQTVEQLELRLRGFLLKPTRRNKPLSPMFMILLTLRFFATGSFQMVVGDLLKVDRATACRTIHKVCYAIAALKPDYIKMPSGNDVRKTMRDVFLCNAVSRYLGCYRLHPYTNHFSRRGKCRSIQELAWIFFPECAGNM